VNADIIQGLAISIIDGD